MVLNIFLLIVGFFMLVRGADYLVQGAASLATRLGVRKFVVGLTVVAFGTSAPELVVNLFSAVSGSGGLAVGNIFGSNLANTLLILGTIGAISAVKLTRGTVWKEIPFALLAAVLVLVMGSDVLLDQQAVDVISRIDGIVLLAFFVIFMYYTFGISGAEDGEGEDIEKLSVPWSVFYTVLGIVGLGFGGKFIVDSAVSIAQTLGVSEHVIGATVVAIGTSLPELVTAVVAARKKHSDMAVGNVIGSNIFNIFFVLATTATVVPLAFGRAAMEDALALIAISIFLFFTLFVGKKNTVERWQGFTFLGLYAMYIVWSIIRGAV